MKDIKGQRFQRETRMEPDSVDTEERTVEVAFSSEEPVERYFGLEILDHSPKSVRLDRLKNGGAVLMDHNTRDQIGVVEDARIDPDRKGRALIRFSKSIRGEEIFQDVVDKIRSLISVGYAIHDYDVTEGKNGEVDTVRVTDHEPYEISFVAVPADATVGVGRSGFSETSNEETKAMKDKPTNAPKEEARQDSSTDEVEGNEQQTESPSEAIEAAVDKRERDKRNDLMRQVAGKFTDVDGVDKLAERFIELNGTVEDFQRAVLKMLGNLTPIPVTREPIITGGSPRYKKMKAFQNTREGERSAYHMGQWARGVLFGDSRAVQWCNDHNVRVAVEGVLSKGGAVVPDEMSQAIVDLREQYGVARRLCRVVPMGSDTLSVPRRTGGVTAYWVGEAASITASDKAWDQVNLVARKLAALSRLSTEYAEDAIIDVADDLASEMAYAFAAAEDDALFNGDGTSTYGGIYGLRPKIIDGNHAAGAVDGASGIDTFAEVTAADVENVMAVLPVYAEAGAAFVCSKPCKTLVFDSLAAATGGTTMTEIGGRPQMSYLGYPIELAQKMPTSTGDLSNVAMFFFGNMAQAVTIGDRRGFTVQVLNELYAVTDEIGVKATERLDIVVHDLGDGTTAGPVAALIGE